MDDLISRQAAIERIEAEYQAWGDEYDVRQILGDLEDLPSAQPERWIPVSERLPEEWQSCLVTQAVVNGMRIVIIATFTSDLYKFDIYDFAGREGEHGWVRYDDEYGRYYDVDVLAWMPLPDPYKGE